MPEAVSSEPFVLLASSLKKVGLLEHSHRLESVLNGTWTTSSELIAELGAVVLKIRKECPLTQDQKRLVSQCLRQVRKAWPGFGMFAWLRFW